MADWWEESAKPALRSLCIVFSKKAARERRDMKDLVYGMLERAIELKDWRLVAMLKEKLRQIFQYELNGVIIRSRYQQEAEEERAGLFHAGKEIRNGAKTGIERLKVKREEGHDIIEDEDEIEERLFKFYDALFNARLDSNLEDTGSPTIPQMHLHHDEFLKDLPKLSEASKRKLKAKLTLDEVKTALDEMENGKSPGEDGLPKEIYAALWSFIWGGHAEGFPDSARQTTPPRVLHQGTYSPGP